MGIARPSPDLAFSLPVHVEIGSPGTCPL